MIRLSCAPILLGRTPFGRGVLQPFQRIIQDSLLAFLQHGAIEAFLQVRNKRRIRNELAYPFHINTGNNALQCAVTVLILQGRNKIKILDLFPVDHDRRGGDLENAAWGYKLLPQS